MDVLLMLAQAFAWPFAVSRVFLWLLRRWDAGWTRLAVAHALSLAGLWGAAVYAKTFDWSAGVAYLLPQLIWFAVDAWRHRRTPAAGAAP